MKLTYRQAYDRIVDAYFKDQLNPWSDCACFVGNLLGSGIWQHACTDNSIYAYKRPSRFNTSYELNGQLKGLLFIDEYGYSSEQITSLENCFISIVGKNSSESSIRSDYEDILFNAMSSTLDMLKKIHEENGEVVEAPVFTKRQLQSA